MCGGEQEAAALTPAASAVAPGDAGPAAEGGSKPPVHAVERTLPAEELANGADWAAIAKGEAEVVQGEAPGACGSPEVAFPSVVASACAQPSLCLVAGCTMVI